MKINRSSGHTQASPILTFQALVGHRRCGWQSSTQGRHPRQQA